MAPFFAALFAASATTTAVAGTTAVVAGSTAVVGTATTIGATIGATAPFIPAVGGGLTVGTVGGATITTGAGLTSLTAGGGGLFAGLTTAELLQAGQAGFSILSGVAGFGEAQQAKKIAKAEADRARIAGLQSINDINQELIERAAFNNANTLAAGVKLSGSADRVNEELAISANRNIDINRGNAKVKSSVAKLRSKQATAAGAGSLLRGFGKATTSVLKLVA